MTNLRGTFARSGNVTGSALPQKSLTAVPTTISMNRDCPKRLYNTLRPCRYCIGSLARLRLARDTASAVGFLTKSGCARWCYGRPRSKYRRHAFHTIFAFKWLLVLISGRGGMAETLLQPSGQVLVASLTTSEHFLPLSRLRNLESAAGLLLGAIATSPQKLIGGASVAKAVLLLIAIPPIWQPPALDGVS